MYWFCIVQWDLGWDESIEVFNKFLIHVLFLYLRSNDICSGVTSQ